MSARNAVKVPKREDHSRLLTIKLCEFVKYSTSNTSMASLISRLKCACVSSKLSCTIGRGGTVLARRRCILVLNASGTGVPKSCLCWICSHTIFICFQGSLSDSGSPRTSDSSMARRKAVLNSRRKLSAWHISSDTLWLMVWRSARAARISSRISLWLIFSRSDRW